MSVKRFDGTNWIDASSIKRFDGTNWIAASSVKRFDGTNWIESLKKTLTSKNTYVEASVGSSVGILSGALYFNFKNYAASTQYVGYRIDGSFTNPTCEVSLNNMLQDYSSMVGCYLVAQNPDGSFVNRYIGVNNGTYGFMFTGTFKSVGVYADCNPNHSMSGTFSNFSVDTVAYNFS